MSRPWRATCLLVFVAAVACGDKKPPKAEQAPKPEAQPAPTATPEPAPKPPPKPVVGTFELGGASEKEALAKVSAVPVWRAVVLRSELLARRGNSGAIHGRVRDTEAGLFISDETEGAGALAARLVVPEGMELADNTRVVAWGAWKPAEAVGDWAWSADRVDALAPADGVLPEPPGLAVQTSKPKGLVPLGKLIARPPKPGDPPPTEPFEPVELPAATAFYIRWKPDKQGDRWGISDSKKGRILAEVSFPGETAAYGGLDYRADGERWKLERGVQYWVVVGKRRQPRKPDEVVRLRAVSVPKRVK